MSRSKKGESKEKKEEFVGTLRMVHKEMDEEMEEHAITAASQSINQFYRGEVKHFHEIAKAVKEAFDEKYPGSWHVIVGKSYGSFVTHQASRMIYFFLGQVGFLIFQHG